MPARPAERCEAGEADPCPPAGAAPWADNDPYGLRVTDAEGLILVKDKLLRIITTGFYIGDCPILKGTLGTLEGILLYGIIIWLCPSPWRDLVLGLMLLILTGLCLITGNWAERHFQQKDPPPFILDEIAGFLLAGLFITPSWLNIILVFILFRLFDIIKPFPLKKVQSLPAGAGIVLDDLLAGFYTNLVVQIITRLIPNFLS